MTRLVQMSLVLLAIGASGVGAADEKSKWEFEVEPYGWAPGNFGSVTVKGRTAHIAVTLSDLYGLLEDGNAFAAAGYFSVSYDRFSIFADSMGGYAEESVTETIPTKFCTLSLRARDKIRFALADFALGYRLGEWSLPDRRRPLTLGVYAGTRYMYFGNKLNATGGVVHGKQFSANVNESFAWRWRRSTRTSTWATARSTSTARTAWATSTCRCAARSAAAASYFETTPAFAEENPERNVYFGSVAGRLTVVPPRRQPARRPAATVRRGAPRGRFPPSRRFLPTRVSRGPR